MLVYSDLSFTKLLGHSQLKHSKCESVLNWLTQILGFHTLMKEKNAEEASAEEKNAEEKNAE